MHRRTSRSLTLLAAALSMLALVAGACSNDSEDAEDDSSAITTEAEASDTDPEEAAGESAAGGDFSKAMIETRKSIEGSNDACDVSDAFFSLSEVGDPETKDETREAVETYVAIVNKMADTASDPETADTLRDGAKAFEEFAKDVDYDPEKMDISGSGPDFESVDDLNDAMDSYMNTEFVDCELPAGMAPEGDIDG